MKISPPQAAQVIRYSYLWADEHDAGREEGGKDRPAAIVMVVQKEFDELQVVVVPITHSRPFGEDDALELPQPVKRQIGLDDERSWVVLTEIKYQWRNWQVVKVLEMDSMLPRIKDAYLTS